MKIWYRDLVWKSGNKRPRRVHKRHCYIPSVKVRRFCFLTGQIRITCRWTKRRVHCVAMVRGQHEFC